MTSGYAWSTVAAWADHGLMATPAVEHEQADQPVCWCCGKTFVEDSELTRLGAHPEVGVCAMCAHWLQRRARWAVDARRRTPGALVRRGVGSARGRVMRAGAHDWPIIGPLLRRLDQYLP